MAAWLKRYTRPQGEAALRASNATELGHKTLEIRQAVYRVPSRVSVLPGEGSTRALWVFYGFLQVLVSGGGGGGGGWGLGD